jgi:hypothetical protein
MNQDLPLACSLTAPELQVRGDEIAVLAEQVQAVRDLADGYAFAFPADARYAHALLDFIVAERACCPFFTFTLEFPSPHAQVWLRIQGREGVKEIIAASSFAPAIARFSTTTVTP